MDDLDLVEARVDLESALSQLPDRQRAVLQFRYGFPEGPQHTLEDCAKEFHLSRESIRVIEAKAMRKLRYSAHKNYLRDYVDRIW